MYPSDTSELRVGQFSVRVAKPNNFSSAFWPLETRSGGRYCPIPHQMEYGLILSNHRWTRCDATVYIDGKDVGTWRIGPYRSVTIERPVNQARKFTFVEEGSLEAEANGVRTGDSKNGLIKVVFRPEKNNYPILNSINHPVEEAYLDGATLHQQSFGSVGMARSMAQSKYGAGGTILGDRSRQRFRTVTPITDYDPEHQTTINLRLVSRVNEPAYAPLEPVGKSNPVPEPISHLDDPIEYQPIPPCGGGCRRISRPWDHPDLRF